MRSNVASASYPESKVKQLIMTMCNDACCFPFCFYIGVAFEQGKTLPTPETVPFRLTRDVIDGMGMAGVEGVFRRCCEKTMSLLRAHQEELRTIVEVCMTQLLIMITKQMQHIAGMSEGWVLYNSLF